MEVDNKQKLKKTEETPKTAKNKPEDKDVQVQKKDAEEESEEDEDSEDESDDDDDEEEESGEDESEEDESDEDDDDEDEDESDEEDEITTSLTAKKTVQKEAKGAKKKPVTNGVVKEDKKNKQEKNKTPAQQQPRTPKTGANKDDAKKSGNKTPQSLDMDKIKEKLLKTPNLPKKVDKFKNYLKHSHKVTDEAVSTSSPSFTCHSYYSYSDHHFI
ncbi:nucleoplasmin-like protein ANO39 [Orbicella faveolata]|uniref:nucleoplasmin-like protein ANO39 n=1 Tax=Orbicella faveolata TaxID=48498 RepID=UPI0009E36A9F|nr:nucleoplasmin-like protein ANO39 [Orbicella faveolata]